MRKEARQIREHTIAEVCRYHHGDHGKFCIYTSDRPLEATDKHYTHFINGNPIEKALFGFEWETQVWGITNKTIYANILRDVVFQPFHENLWKIEDDCSLTRNADSCAECITQPMTKAYIRNHYRDFRYMWEKAKAFGIDCETTGDCGMHIHISNTAFGRTKKTQDEAIKKLLYIINKHYEFFLYCLYRNPNRRNYCPKMTGLDNKINAKTIDLSNQWDDHHACINMGHYNNGNIELRIVGGQKNYACFRNTFECVFHIMEAVKNISWDDCDDIVKIFSGCNQYVYDRLATYVKQNGKISNEQLSEIRYTVKTEELI